MKLLKAGLLSPDREGVVFLDGTVSYVRRDAFQLVAVFALERGDYPVRVPGTVPDPALWLLVAVLKEGIAQNGPDAPANLFFNLQTAPVASLPTRVFTAPRSLQELRTGRRDDPEARPAYDVWRTRLEPALRDHGLARADYLRLAETAALELKAALRDGRFALW